MNWIPDDYRQPSAGLAPGAGAPQTPPPDGPAPGDQAAKTSVQAGGEPGEGPPPFEPAPSRAGGLPDLSPVALAAGVVGLLTGPFLIDDATARYVILAADLVALTFGALAVWVSLKRFGRLDYAVAAIITGGVSLFLWVRYVSDPPQGGT